MAKTAKGVPWDRGPSKKEPVKINDCFVVSFDIGENFDVPIAIVGKQSSNGFHVINMFQEDDAIALYETLVGEELA